MIAVSLDRVKPVIELQIELQRTQRQHRLRNLLSSGGDRIFPSLFYLGNFEQQSFHASDPLVSPFKLILSFIRHGHGVRRAAASAPLTPARPKGGSSQRFPAPLTLGSYSELRLKIIVSAI
jgi:hypothetical protein